MNPRVKPGVLAVAAFSIVAALPSARAADPAPPGTGAGAAPRAERPQEPQTPAARPRGEAVRDADARHCLEFPDNFQVIACAEKYRPHKRGA